MATTKTAMGNLFPAEVATEVFNAVRDHSALAKLSAQQPIPFTGVDVFTFNLDGEVSIVGEAGEKPAGSAVIGKVEVRPLKVIYQHRVSDEFVNASDERRVEILSAFRDGFSRKIASGFDLMAMHGVNPATSEASAIIGTNHLDSGTTAVTYAEADGADAALEAAVGELGSYSVSGIAVSRTFASVMAQQRINGVPVYPELKLGGSPDRLNSILFDANNTVNRISVTEGGSTVYDAAIVGDFASAFRWGFAKQIPYKLIEYGDPDGQGDLQRTNEVILRAEAYIGWGILDKSAFARVVKATQ